MKNHALAAAERHPRVDPDDVVVVLDAEFAGLVGVVGERVGRDLDGVVDGDDENGQSIHVLGPYVSN